MKIAFLGTGLMGSRMAKNLLKDGHELAVYNRTKSKTNMLVESGAERYDTPSSAVQEKQVIITVLANPSAVQQVAAGKDGFLKKAEKDAVWINCSTVNPSFAREMDNWAKEKQLHYLDAPVAGSVKPAEKGELTFLVGGSRKIQLDMAPLFENMGKKTVYLGETGKGSAMKMVFNLLLGQAMTAFSEAMSFAAAQELDIEQTLEILSGSPVIAPFIKGKIENLKSRNYPVEFPLNHMIKDLNLASQTAWEKSAFLPVGNLTKEIMISVENRLSEEADFSAVFEAFTSPKNNF